MVMMKGRARVGRRVRVRVKVRKSYSLNSKISSMTNYHFLKNEEKRPNHYK